MRDRVLHQLKQGNESQLICFPYLGGHANSYLELAGSINKDIEIWCITPPGHGHSEREPISGIDSLLNLYCDEIQTIIKPGCVLFGHSMGGIIAYLLAQKLLGTNRLFQFKALIISAINTPDHFRDKHYHHLSDEALIDYLLSFDAIQKEIIAEKTLLSYFLPNFRADLKILADASELCCQALKIPTYFLWGEADKFVPIEAALQWSRYCVDDIHLIPIKQGTHMFIQKQAKIVANILENIISC